MLHYSQPKFEKSISKDVRTAGYSTTLGPAEFKNSKDNKSNVSANIQLHPGRPPKVSNSLIHLKYSSNIPQIMTGRAGRPPKRKLKKDLMREAQIVANRKLKVMFEICFSLFYL